MNATFLVELNVESDTDFLGIAEDIDHHLTLAGFDVVSAKPWAREAVTLQQPFAQPLVPNPQPPVG